MDYYLGSGQSVTLRRKSTAGRNGTACGSRPKNRKTHDFIEAMDCYLGFGTVGDAMPEFNGWTQRNSIQRFGREQKNCRPEL